MADGSPSQLRTVKRNLFKTLSIFQVMVRIQAYVHLRTLRAFEVIWLILIHFSCASYRSKEEVQVHLNKLECRGKVNLFQ